MLIFLLNLASSQSLWSPVKLNSKFEVQTNFRCSSVPTSSFWIAYHPIYAVGKHTFHPGKLVSHLSFLLSRSLRLQAKAKICSHLWCCLWCMTMVSDGQVPQTTASYISNYRYWEHRIGKAWWSRWFRNQYGYEGKQDQETAFKDKVSGFSNWSNRMYLIGLDSMEFDKW